MNAMHLNKIYLFYITYMSFFPACVYVQYMAWHLKRSDEDTDLQELGMVVRHHVSAGN